MFYILKFSRGSCWIVLGGEGRKDCLSTTTAATTAADVRVDVDVDVL